MKISTLLSGLFGLTTLNALYAETNNGSFYKTPAPIGVMGDHRHEKGKLMASYRYQFMRMQSNYDGTSRVSDDQVLADPRFAVTPTDMDMEMHMFGFMYAPTDRVTLMAMVNLVEMSMNHRFAPMGGGTFRTSSSGIGDASIGAIVGLWQDETSSLNFGFNVLLPTAETDEEDFIPLMGGRTVRLPYPMQLGSGSWGINPSLTWTGKAGGFDYGAQVGARIFLADNDEDYRLGNRINLTAWGSRPLTENFSLSLRANFSDWSNIHGSDDRISGPVPTADPDLRGGQELSLLLGASYLEPRSGVRASVEVGKTVWRDLDGPQLSNDFSVTAGLQFSW